MGLVDELLNTYESGLERNMIYGSKLKVVFDKSARNILHRIIQEIVSYKPSIITEYAFDSVTGLKTTGEIVEDLLICNDGYALSRFASLRRVLLDEDFPGEEARSIAACIYKLDNTIRSKNGYNLCKLTKKLSENLIFELKGVKPSLNSLSYTDFKKKYFMDLLRWMDSLREKGFEISGFRKKEFSELINHYITDRHIFKDTEGFTRELFDIMGLGVPITMEEIFDVYFEDDTMIIPIQIQ